MRREKKSFGQFWLKLTFGLGCMLILASSLLPAASSLALSPGLDLTTSPAPIDLAGKPGTTLSTVLRVKNDNSDTEKLKVSLMKFSAYGETGQPKLESRQPGDNYFDWVSFSPAVFEAPSNVWVNVRMSIKLPPSAALGYYYAAVFSRADTPSFNPAAGKRQNVVLGSTAVLVLVDAQVPGAVRQVKLVSFSADHSSYEFLPASFSVKLHNSGNIHVVPHGDIFIMKGSKQIADLVLNPGGGNILPGTNRIFTASWSDGWPAYQPKVEGDKVVDDKNGKPEMSLNWNFSHIQKLRFGHYSANLLMAYDNGTSDVPLSGSVGFWVVPWRVIGLIILIPTVPALLVYLLMRRRLKKAALKAKPASQK